MYSQFERSFIHEKFWISFGKYMSPVPSAAGGKINWVNYKTGVRYVNFKMDVSDHFAIISIELSHKHSGDRKHAYQKFHSLKNVFEAILEEGWSWEEEELHKPGAPLSVISNTLRNINIFRELDWPAIISFLKTRLIALDKFWTEYSVLFSNDNTWDTLYKQFVL